MIVNYFPDGVLDNEDALPFDDIPSAQAAEYLLHEIPVVRRVGKQNIKGLTPLLQGAYAFSRIDRQDIILTGK